MAASHYLSLMLQFWNISVAYSPPLFDILNLCLFSSCDLICPYMDATVRDVSVFICTFYTKINSIVALLPASSIIIHYLN